MANYTKLTDLFTGIANAIRSKTGGSSEIIADNFPSEINNIVTVQEGTADATATVGDIASGKTAYVNGEKVTGIATLNNITLNKIGTLTWTATGTLNSRYSHYQVHGFISTFGSANCSITPRCIGVARNVPAVMVSTTDSDGTNYVVYIYSGISTIPVGTVFDIYKYNA